MADPDPLWFGVSKQVTFPSPIAQDVEYHLSPPARVAVTFRATTLPGAAACGEPETTSLVCVASTSVTEMPLALDAVEPSAGFELACPDPTKPERASMQTAPTTEQMP